MFSSKNKSERKPHREGEVPPSIVASDMEVNKDGIVSKGEVHIDGKVSGNIVAREVMVGREAQVTGNITAQLVRVDGNVTGAINAAEVNLLSHAHVEGDITHSIMSIEAGAYFDGSSKRRPEAPKPEIKQLTNQKSTTMTTTEISEKGKVTVAREVKLAASR
ncbi:MAG: polymer-forming cytoskeletal protein [Candidatus Pacebacteria bacterium]|nr:polymer-forming cytoskeletal protein [Candidatus Paceibacterota bacterium]